MNATIDFSLVAMLTGTVNTPLWFSALRPADLMSAAAALNPDASPVWFAAQAFRVDTDPSRSQPEEFRQ
ncbi:MAG: hypothetical protein JHC79_10540 [Williamsia sp.]|nr:hypothetical protein [Williamsia sp.]